MTVKMKLFPPTSDGCATESPNLNVLKALERLSLETTLNLTAPVCSNIIQNHRQNWVQLSGHPGSLAPAGPGTIWKKQPGDTCETWAYEELMKDVGKEIVPKFFREVSYEGDKFIELTDLLYKFTNPCVMDIKMGSRTFLESEVSNSKSRKDLYEKMVKVDPSAPSPEEHSAQSVTKLRYMDFRDNMSSSRSLGFRIEALKMSDSSYVTEIKKVRTREEVVQVLSSFVQRKDSVRKQILKRIKHIKQIFEASQFFMNHEIIGSSILIVYDDSHFGAWIIDFGKTRPLPENLKTNHRGEWQLGNHEEGYLMGLDNLIKLFGELTVKKNPRLSFFKKS